jgi:hypothetical protein
VSYFYRAYGVGIHSLTRIPGLEPAALSSTDFTFRFETGPQPDWVKCAISLPGRILSHLPEDKRSADPSFVLTEHGNGKCYDLAYSDGARFVVDKTAERMWASALPPLGPEDLAVYLLGPVMGFLLRHLHITCLHASAVQVHGRAILFSGDAGFGKSTTAAALALRGVPVLCEVLVPLESTEDQYLAIPGYPRVCLWPDSVAKLLGDQESLPLISPNWSKRYLPLDGRHATFAEAKKLLGIIYLFGERSPDSNAPHIAAMRPKDALLELVQNTYMNWLLDRQRRAEEFDELYKLVQQVPVRRIVAHTDGARLPLLCDRILEDAQNVLAKV